MLMGLGFALCLLGGILFVAPAFIHTRKFDEGWFMVIGIVLIVCGIISFACA